MFKRLEFLISFTKIYKCCIDICIIYGLQDSCNLDVNRGVGAKRTTPSGERLNTPVTASSENVADWCTHGFFFSPFFKVAVAIDFRKLGIKRFNMRWYLRVKTAGRSL